jgi:outer membrane protein assembly factor BamD
MRWLFLLPIGALFLGCQLFSGGENAEPTYAGKADENIRLGKQALANKSFPEAAKYFEFVRTKYPFLDAAKEAELLLADTDFEREQYSEARDRYEGFVKIHPNHAKVDYAAYRAALTHYKEIPSDFFVLPPPHEKDQAAIKLAAESMAEFIRNYPKSQYLEEAHAIEVDARRRLARHELYVADFYSKRQRWPAVAGRLELLVTKYAGTGLDVEAYLRLHEVYRKLGEPRKATDALERLVAKYPDSPEAARAQRLLSEH